MAHQQAAKIRITAALIARDEERVIDDCLASVQGHVDEIVVVDTGSRDTTPEIVRGHGGRLLHRAWDDDFAAPRNVAVASWAVLIIRQPRVLYRPLSKLWRANWGPTEFALMQWRPA